MSESSTSLALPAARSDVQLVDLWLHGRPENTIRAYRADATKFRDGAGKPLAWVTLADLQAFADSLACQSPGTRYRTLSAVKSLLCFGHRVGYLAYDVGRALRLPPVRVRLAERILPEAALQRIVTGERNPRNRAILALLYASGLRVSELCGLNWGDVQPSRETGQITVLGKGGKTRAVVLPREAWDILCGLRPGDARLSDPVFPSRKRAGEGRLGPLAVRRIVRKAAVRAGLDAPVSPHWFRHAHASHALDHGAPIHLVQATLGHSSINTTGRYLHARPQESSGKFLPSLNFEDAS